VHIEQLGWQGKQISRPANGLKRPIVEFLTLSEKKPTGHLLDFGKHLISDDGNCIAR
jgi:hypothetical protein